MRVLVAPLEMKGVLTAREISRVMSEALAASGWEVDVCPLSDGGPGLLDALSHPSERRQARVADARGRPIEATWAHPPEGSALIEMAQAAGLTRLPVELRDPRVTTTFGVGELVRVALDEGCTAVAIGAGGSATNDGGAGALQALGVRLLDGSGRALCPGGAALQALERIDASAMDARLRATPLTVLCDVDNPLLGPSGCTRTFGAQKGADGSAMAALERGLERWAEVIRYTFGFDLAQSERTGAAGGLSYGLAALCGARLVSGFEWVAERTGLAGRIRRADVVFTSEGQLDEQSLRGKGTVRLAELARAEGKPCVAWVGRRALKATAETFEQVVEVSPELSPSIASTAGEEISRRLRAALSAWAFAKHRT